MKDRWRIQMNKHALFIFVLVSLTHLVQETTHAQTYDASVLWIKAYGQYPALSNNHFGNRIGNTWGLDTSALYPWKYREQEPPPMLPGFSCFWAKIRTGQFGTFRGLLDRDFRDYSSPLQKDTFKLAFAQNDNTAATISLKWPDPVYLSAHCDSLFLKYTDPILGPTFINMFTQDSITFPMAYDQGILNVWLYKTGVHLIETGVNETFLPATFFLSQNYPNPFNPETEIRYQIAERSHVLLRIFDVLGREVATLVNEMKEPGEYSATWDASRAVSGVYFYRLQTGKYVETKKMVVIR